MSRDSLKLPHEFKLAALGAEPLKVSPLAGALAKAMQYQVPASQTPEGKERIRAYFEALGHFADMFSRVETAVTLTLWAYAKTKPEVARVVFAGTKINVAMHYIKQLVEAGGYPPEISTDLDDVFQQLGIINGARNDVMHFGATSVAEGNAIVSNALKAKGEPTVFPISPTALADMTADLRKITFHLNFRHLGRPEPRSDEGRGILGSLLLAPWRYRHPVLPKSQTKTGKSRRSRKRGTK